MMSPIAPVSSASDTVASSVEASFVPRGTRTAQEIAKAFAWTPWTIVGGITGFTAGAMYASSLSTESTITPAVIFGGTIAGLVGVGVGALGSVVFKATWLGTELAHTAKVS